MEKSILYTSVVTSICTCCLAYKRIPQPCLNQVNDLKNTIMHTRQSMFVIPIRCFAYSFVPVFPRADAYVYHNKQQHIMKRQLGRKTVKTETSETRHTTYLLLWTTGFCYYSYIVVIQVTFCRANTHQLFHFPRTYEVTLTQILWQRCAISNAHACILCDATSVVVDDVSTNTFLWYPLDLLG